MGRPCALLALALWSAAAVAQNQIAPGTIIPIVLARGLDADHARPGEPIRAQVMQDIPGTPIRRRATVIGHVVGAAGSRSSGAELAICFDAVRVHGESIPLKTNLRALASFMEVDAAQIPEDMSARGTTPETAITQQIGGEQVYRGGGPVAAGDVAVGKPTPYGALGLPRARPDQPCRGEVDGNTRPQAFWLFSTDACGVYGLEHVRIVHFGRTDPIGTIKLEAEKGKLKLSSGTAMLLRVQGT